MASLLPNIVNNAVEGIHKIKCKYGNGNRKRVESNTNIASPVLNTHAL